jgi:CRISPR-associated exonuclease Cas4
LKDWNRKYWKDADYYLDQEEDYLLLSGIQHFAFCRRQWALIHIEQQWAENYRTMDGRIMHKNAHDMDFHETRGNVIIRRGMPVISHTLHVQGVCDIVEFVQTKDGITLNGREGTFAVESVEYKRGRPKEENADILQVVAQSMCLEEMFSCRIPVSYLYYGETHHRMKVINTQDLRDQVCHMLNEMYQDYQRRYTPKVKWSKSCNACSLRDLCLPQLGKRKSAQKYIEEAIQE